MYQNVGFNPHLAVENLDILLGYGTLLVLFIDGHVEYNTGRNSLISTQNQPDNQ